VIVTGQVARQTPLQTSLDQRLYGYNLPTGTGLRIASLRPAVPASVSSWQAQGTAPAQQFVWQGQFDRLLGAAQPSAGGAVAEQQQPVWADDWEPPAAESWTGFAPDGEDFAWTGQNPVWLEIPRAWEVAFE
jgi:hypothetical protein